MTDRPNFFELLGLDPEKETGWTVVERRIREMKGTWARDHTMGSPKKRQEAKQNLGLLKEIEKVLADPASRRQEAEAARRLRRETRKTLEKDLAGWIELLKASGRCRPEQFERLCSHFAGAFSPEELHRHLLAAGVRVVEPRIWERTDPSIAKDIRGKLSLMKLASLYEFLGLPATSPADALRARAEAIYKQNLNLGRTDAVASAQNGLVGPAKLVFSSEEAKRKYDNELVLTAFESLDDQIGLAGADGVLSAQEFELLIRLAVQRGISEAVALDLLDERAAKNGWRVETAPSWPAPAPDPSLGRSREFSLKDTSEESRGLLIRKITNVTSKSFGIVIEDDEGQKVVTNLIRRDDVVPCTEVYQFDIREDNPSSLEIRCMENVSRDSRVEVSECREIGQAVLSFGQPLPRGSQVEIAFHLGPDGLLAVNGKELTNGKLISAVFRTEAILSKESLEMSRQRNLAIAIGPNISKTAPHERNQIFISYSHQDRDWLDRFKVMLKPILRNHTVSLWDDTQIAPGTNWRKEIEKAVASARVAILLVSANFLHSDFIHENELLPLLRAAEAERDGPKVIWLCLTHCLFEVTELKHLQAAHNPQRPLAGLRKSEKEKVLADIGRYIERLFTTPSR